MEIVTSSKTFALLPLPKINKLVLLVLSLFFFFSVSKLSGAAPAPIKILISNFQISGDLPIAYDETMQFLSSYENAEYDLAELQSVSKILEKKIRDAGFAFYRVVIPAQNISDGTVEFKIVSFQIDTIDTSSMKYFERDNILSSLPLLTEGSSPNTKALARQIKAANHHANKDVSVIFKQSKKIDHIDAKIDVTETEPLQLAVFANNTGSADTGKARLTMAVQHSNLWNKDHSANLSYTTSPNHTSDVSQIGMSYSLPLYDQNSWLTSYYAYSDVDTGSVSITGGDIDVSGSGEMFGLHYLHFLLPIDSYEHKIGLGFDNRFFENTADLTLYNIGLGDISPDIRSTPLSITYSGNIAFGNYAFAHHVSWSKNLGIGSLNDDKAYENMGFSTGYPHKKNWDLFRYGFTTSKQINNWMLRADWKGQYSNDAIIPGEQFGLGGVQTIRGYDEREVSGDIGNSLSLETYTPSWKGANLVAFYDYGKIRNQHSVTGIKNKWSLSSVGVGLRWQWQTQVQISLDLAHTLKDGLSTKNHQNNLHASFALFY